MVVVFVSLAQASVPTTSAAWTDRAVVKGTVTAASAWLSPFTGNTCKAYSSPTAAPTTCAITAIRYEEISDTSGHFYISTNAPGGSHHVDVDVDLKKATGLPGRGPRGTLRGAPGQSRHAGPRVDVLLVAPAHRTQPRLAPHRPSGSRDAAPHHGGHDLHLSLLGAAQLLSARAAAVGS